MKTPISKIFDKTNIIAILILFFGIMIVYYLLTYIGFYEGMVGGNSISGEPTTVTTKYPF